MDCPEERPSPEQSARLDALAKSMLVNEIESLQEQNEAMQIALKQAQAALAAISGTLAIYRAHQP